MHVRSIFLLLPCAIIELAALFAFAIDAPPRAPLPDEAAQTEAMKLVHEVYGAELAAAKTAAQKKTLAKKLLAEADSSRDDHTGKYVLLKAAKSVAVLAVDADTAFEAIDHLAESFEIDALPMKVGTLSALSHNARSTSEQAVLAQAATDLLESATAEERFDLAAQLAQLALDAARKARNPPLVRQVQKLTAEVQQKADACHQAKVALEALKKDPNDPAANLVVGKYRCFGRGDWQEGLPMLAKGSDANLKSLAADELKGAVSPSAQANLGDAWWELAKNEQGTAKRQCQSRAQYWYEQALPSLTGLTKDKVVKRIEESKASDESAPAVARAEKDHWLLIFRSSDPTVWNTDSPDKNRFATPLDKAPPDTRYLKMQLNRKDYVVFPLSKDKLGDACNRERYGWEGRNNLVWGGRQLGLFDRKTPRNHDDICIAYESPALGGLSGWGFGYKEGANVQGWAWNGRPVEKTILEIYVTSGALSASEKRHLLK